MSKKKSSTLGVARRVDHLPTPEIGIHPMLTHPPVASDLILSIALGVQARSHGRVRNLNILLDGESVVLRGETASYHAKQLAQDGALNAIEDRQLVNQIVVISL